MLGRSMRLTGPTPRDGLTRKRTLRERICNRLMALRKATPLLLLAGLKPPATDHLQRRLLVSEEVKLMESEGR